MQFKGKGGEIDLLLGYWEISTYFTSEFLTFSSNLYRIEAESCFKLRFPWKTAGNREKPLVYSGRAQPRRIRS